ncbi:MAG TPA: hypothetical protein VMF30_02055 [Pirellulales bacterium]|nr:hypothetical protein [Pirellulales bacterium]
MIRTLRWIVFSFVVVLGFASAMCAQEAAEANDEKPDAAADGPQPQVIKVYQVSDLILRVPDYPYDGTYLPAMRDLRTFPGQAPQPAYGGGMMGGTGGGVGGGMMGGGMGGMGGGMGGMGGGMFQIPAEGATLAQRGGGGQGGGQGGMLPGVQRSLLPQLIEVITDNVAPNTWDEVGGSGSISAMGSALVISQTAAIHAEVKDLLDQLRREQPKVQALTIKARWVSSDASLLAALKQAEDPKKPAAERRAPSREEVERILANKIRYEGQITCFNGQTVYVVSGRMETVLQGGIPVVGGGVPAYQATVLTPQLGALLQVTASGLPGDEAALLNLRSSVARGDEPRKPVKFLEGGVGDQSDLPAVQVDRLNVAVQQFATTVRVPYGQPMLVGGMTFPGRDETVGSETIYLVVEVEPVN